MQRASWINGLLQSPWPTLWSLNRSNRKNRRFIRIFLLAIWPKLSSQTVADPSSAYWRCAYQAPWPQTGSTARVELEYDDQLMHIQSTQVFFLPNKSSPQRSAWNLKVNDFSCNSSDLYCASEGIICFQWCPRHKYIPCEAFPCTGTQFLSRGKNGLWWEE